MAMVKKKKLVIQVHHISYNPEVTVILWKGEHYILTLMGRRKHISRGFLDALTVYIKENSDKAMELKEVNEK